MFSFVKKKNGEYQRYSPKIFKINLDIYPIVVHAYQM